MLTAHAILLLILGANASGCIDGLPVLTVWQRSIDPSHVIVQRIWTTGKYERIEVQASYDAVVSVSASKVDQVERIFSDLHDAGFFVWPDSTLQPPRGVDVDSDPLRIMFAWKANSRILDTRQPYVPEALTRTLAGLERVASLATEVDSCVVCSSRTARVKPVHLDERDYSETRMWDSHLRSAFENDFPVVIPHDEVEEPKPVHGDKFIVHIADKDKLVTCVGWCPKPDK